MEEEDVVQPNGLTIAEMQLIAHFVHNRAEYLEGQVDGNRLNFVLWLMHERGLFNEWGVEDTYGSMTVPEQTKRKQKRSEASTHKGFFGEGFFTKGI